MVRPESTETRQLQRKHPADARRALSRRQAATGLVFCLAAMSYLGYTILLQVAPPEAIGHLTPSRAPKPSSSVAPQTDPSAATTDLSQVMEPTPSANTVTPLAPETSSPASPPSTIRADQVPPRAPSSTLPENSSLLEPGLIAAKTAPTEERNTFADSTAESLKTLPNPSPRSQFRETEHESPPSIVLELEPQASPDPLFDELMAMVEEPRVRPVAYAPISSLAVSQEPAGATPPATPNASPAAAPSTPAGSNPPASPSPSGNSTPPPPPAAEDPLATNDQHLRDLVAAGRKGLTPFLEAGFYGGTEFTFLATDRVGQLALGLTDLATKEKTTLVGDAGIGAGSRWFLGVQRSSIGVRGRYWTFNEESVADFSNPNPSAWPMLNGTQSIALQVFDLEMTQRHIVGSMLLEGSFGFRHASFDGSGTLVANGFIAEQVQVHGLAHTSRSLNGFGPTFSILGRADLPWTWACGPMSNSHDCQDESCSCGGRWSWYWGVRGSMLWASTFAEAQTEAQTFMQLGDATQGISRSNDYAYIAKEADSQLFQSELLLGVEYRRRLKKLPSFLQLQFGLEHQLWDLGQPFAASQSYAFLQGGPPSVGGQIETTAASGDRFLEMFGLRFSLLLNY